MGMSLGDRIRVTLFGESHGSCVGALLEGVPAGTPIDYELMIQEIEKRRPGKKGMTGRIELDECELLSGVYNGLATGWPILFVATHNTPKHNLVPSPFPDHAYWLNCGSCFAAGSHT